jgi:hypothetical protein
VVDRVHVPLLGFSRTLYTVNPRPGFVAWGGPVWGCLIPVIVFAVVALLRVPGAVRRAAQFFAGFCLIANGAYLGVGWTTGAGDAGDLRRHGTPEWMMVTFGVVTSAFGLYVWHLLGKRAAVEITHPTSRAPDAGV